MLSQLYTGHFMRFHSSIFDQGANGHLFFSATQLKAWEDLVTRERGGLGEIEQVPEPGELVMMKWLF